MLHFVTFLIKYKLVHHKVWDNTERRLFQVVGFGLNNKVVDIHLSSPYYFSKSVFCFAFTINIKTLCNHQPLYSIH